MSSFNLTLSPSQVEFVLKPSVTIIQAYEVANNSSQDIVLNTQILPWVPVGNDGSVSYQQAAISSDLDFSLANSDLKIGQSFILKANSKQQIVLKIKTSKEISLADYYQTFFVYQNQDPLNQDNNFSQATGKIGSHILLSVSNTENTSIKAKLESFKIFPKIKDVFFTPITFSGEIKNDSTYFFKTSGKIIITKNESPVKEIELNNDNVLTNHYRSFSCVDSCKLNSPLWPGKYQVTLKMDENLGIADSSYSFYILPISPILFVLFIVGIIFGIQKIKKLKKQKINLK